MTSSCLYEAEQVIQVGEGVESQLVFEADDLDGGVEIGRPEGDDNDDWLEGARGASVGTAEVVRVNSFSAL